MESATEHQGRILLVDDESAILRTFRYCLEDEGYTVATANSAAQAAAGAAPESVDSQTGKKGR